jgi:hypothetical protein
MTDLPTVTALPAPPQRGQDNAVFIQRADAFIDALILFVTQLNAFAAQLVAATQERVVNEAAGSYAGAIAARDAAIAARDAAQAFANSIDPATLVKTSGNQAIAGTKNFTSVLQLAGAAITAAATFPETTTAEMLANVDKRLLSVRAAWNALVPVVLADAATIPLDLSTGIHFTTAPLGGNRTLAAPTNGKPGQEGFIRVVQDATGGRTLSFAAAYKFADLATAPSLNAAAGAVTLLRYHVSAAGEVFLTGGKPAAGVPTGGYGSGLCYGPRLSALPSNETISATLTHYVAIVVTAPITIAAVVATFNSSSQGYGALYSSVNGRPGVRLGLSPQTTIAAGSAPEFAIGVSVAPGVYWMALSFGPSNVNMYGARGYDMMSDIMPQAQNDSSNFYGAGYYSADAVPPANWASATNAQAVQQGPVPRLKIKVA